MAFILNGAFVRVCVCVCVCVCVRERERESAFLSFILRFSSRYKSSARVLSNIKKMDSEILTGTPTRQNKLRRRLIAIYLVSYLHEILFMGF